MTDNRSYLVAEVERMVGESGRPGLYAHPLYSTEGFVVRGDGVRPTFALSPSDIEAIVRDVEEPKRRLIELRLGVGRAASMRSRDRTAELAQLRGEPKSLTRSDSNFLKALVATTLVARALERRPEPDGPSISLDLYSRVIRLPRGGLGEMVETNHRTIRTHEDGINSYRIHRVDRWNLGEKPKYQMLRGGDYTIDHERQAPDGLRYDVVFHFDAINGTDTVELEWEHKTLLREDPAAPYEPYLYSCAPEQPIREAVISVRLDDPKDFSSCFRFQNVYENDRTSPDIPHKPVSPRGGDVGWRWFHCPVGRSFGLKLYLRQLNTQQQARKATQ